MSHWSSIKEKSGGYWQMQFMLKVYKLLGKKAFKFCLYPIVTVFQIGSKETRDFSHSYLNRIYKIKNQQSPGSFPPVTYKSVFKHIFAFADGLSDKIIAWSGNMPLESVHIKTQDTYNEFLDQLKKKQGVFLISSHFGNIEIFRALGNFHSDKPLGEKLKINTLMQMQHTAHFSKLMQKLNPDVITNVISAIDVGVDTVIDLKDRLGRGEIAIIAGDRTAAKNQDKTLELDFLGDKAHFPLGCFTLASLMESQVYFIFLMKEEDNLYSLYMYKSTAAIKAARNERRLQIEKMAKEYIGYLQNLMPQYPYQWYNFFDFWKGR